MCLDLRGISKQGCALAANPAAATRTWHTVLLGVHAKNACNMFSNETDPCIAPWTKWKTLRFCPHQRMSECCLICLLICVHLLVVQLFVGNASFRGSSSDEGAKEGFSLEPTHENFRPIWSTLINIHELLKYRWLVEGDGAGYCQSGLLSKWIGRQL